MHEIEMSHQSRSRRARTTLASVALSTALVVLSSCGGSADLDRRTWNDYGGGPDNARFSTLDQITKENLTSLEVAWTYPTSDNVSYVWGPVVADGVMYVLARDFSLVALDAATGEEIWIHEGLQGIAPRGINYWASEDGSDRRLLYQRYHYLEALDARTLPSAEILSVLVSLAVSVSGADGA